MADVVMPRLSDSMEEGTILQWLKQVGEEVAVGDELVEIETDKANMAYEADVAGTLTEILVPGGGRRCRSGLRLRGLAIRMESRPPRPRVLTLRRRRPGRAGPVAAEGPSSAQAAGEEPAPSTTRGERPPRPASFRLTRPMGGRKRRRSPDAWRKSVASSFRNSRALALAVGS